MPKRNTNNSGRLNKEDVNTNKPSEGSKLDQLRQKNLSLKMTRNKLLLQSIAPYKAAIGFASTLVLLHAFYYPMHGILELEADENQFRIHTAEIASGHNQTSIESFLTALKDKPSSFPPGLIDDTINVFIGRILHYAKRCNIPHQDMTLLFDVQVITNLSNKFYKICKDKHLILHALFDEMIKNTSKDEFMRSMGAVTMMLPSLLNIAIINPSLNYAYKKIKLDQVTYKEIDTIPAYQWDSENKKLELEIKQLSKVAQRAENFQQGVMGLIIMFIAINYFLETNMISTEMSLLAMSLFLNVMINLLKSLYEHMQAKKLDATLLDVHEQLLASFPDKIKPQIEIVKGQFAGSSLFKISALHHETNEKFVIPKKLLNSMLASIFKNNSIEVVAQSGAYFTIKGDMQFNTSRFYKLVKNTLENCGVSRFGFDSRKLRAIINLALQNYQDIAVLKEDLRLILAKLISDSSQYDMEIKYVKNKFVLKAMLKFSDKNQHYNNKNGLFNIDVIKQLLPDADFEFINQTIVITATKMDDQKRLELDEQINKWREEKAKERDAHNFKTFRGSPTVSYRGVISKPDKGELEEHEYHDVSCLIKVVPTEIIWLTPGLNLKYETCEVVKDTAEGKLLKKELLIIDTDEDGRTIRRKPRPEEVFATFDKDTYAKTFKDPTCMLHPITGSYPNQYGLFDVNTESMRDKDKIKFALVESDFREAAKHQAGARAGSQGVILEGVPKIKVLGSNGKGDGRIFAPRSVMATDDRSVLHHFTVYDPHAH